MMAKGIRSYGPGKFIKIIDEYAYYAATDFGADREESYPEGGGWFGFMGLDRRTTERIRENAHEERDELTEGEEALLDKSVAVIFFERSDGIVEATWFDNMSDADEAWAEIEEEFEDIGDEEDEDDEEGDYEEEDE